jgi:hypothetical protein
MNVTHDSNLHDRSSGESAEGTILPSRGKGVNDILLQKIAEAYWK